MEHIEEAGIHSGDSACCLPPYSLSAETVEAIKTQARALARELDVRGLMNVQFAVPRDGRGIFILEVNPRASRTVPFVSKVTGVPLAKVAARIAAGKTLREMGIKEVTPKHVAVKEAVFPFAKFAGVDTILGPEMRSTGEVMGIAATFATAFGKSQIGAGTRLPTGGHARSCRCRTATRRAPSQVAKGLIDLGFEVVATVGTHTFLTSKGLDVKRVNKVREGRPHIVDRHPRRRHSPGHQHDLGRRGDQGFVPDPAQRPAQGDPLLHDAVGGARRRRRDRGSARGQDDRPLAAGVPEWLSSR